MTRYQEQLAAQVLRVLKAHGWSRRNAEIHTGISYAVVQQMAQGIRPSYQKVLEWARAIRESEDDWLEWAGYGEFVRRPDTPAAAPGATEGVSTTEQGHPGTPAQEGPPQPEPPELTEEQLRLLHWYDGAPPPDRRIVLDLIERLDRLAREPLPDPDEVGDEDPAGDPGEKET